MLLAQILGLRSFIVVMNSLLTLLVCSNLSDPVWIDGKYDDNGKWMDGWESRRRRDGKDDFCFIRLGKKASVKGFNVDTTHFTGNFAPGISIQGCSVPGGTTDDLVVDSSAVTEWFDLLGKKEIKGDSHNRFECLQQIIQLPI